MSGVGSAQSGLQPRAREAGRPPRPPPPRDRRLQHAAVGGRGPRQPPGGGAGEAQEGDREYHTWESLLLIYIRIIVTTLHHIDIVMLVHKICNNGRQRSLKPPISEDGQTSPTSLHPAGCVSAEPAGRQADRAGLRAGGPGQAALPPGHPAGHLGGSQEVSRGKQHETTSGYANIQKMSCVVHFKMYVTGETESLTENCLEDLKATSYVNCVSHV